MAATTPAPSSPPTDPGWPGAGGELDLRRYLLALRRRRWTIGLVTLTAAVIAGLLSAGTTPVYESTSTVLLQRSTPDAVDGLVPVLDTEVQGRIELLLFSSEQVTDAAEARLGGAADIRAELGPDGVSLEVTARSTDPSLAAAAANTYAAAYLDLRRTTKVAEYEATAEVIGQQIARLDADIEAVEAELSEVVPLADTPAGAAATRTLEDERDALLTQRTVFQQRLDSVTVSADLAEADGPVVVQSATVPDRPVEPRPVRDLAVGVALGLMAGVALALVQDHLDDTVRSKADLVAIPGTSHVLGLIPRASGWTSTDEAHVIAQEHPSSAVTEAYRSLRTAVQFAALDRPIRALQLTSPRARDGKTTTSTNLGVVLARSGQRTIIVDFDLRRPRLQQFFGLPNDLGLTSVLLGEVPVEEALQRVPGEPNLFVLTSGPCPPDPSSLLSSDRPGAVVRSLTDGGAMVLVDSPPVLPVADALQLSHVVDAVVLVTKAGTTRRREIASALDSLRQVGAPLVGTVLNEVRSQDTDLGDGYGYGYGSERAPRAPVIDLDR